MKKNIYRTVVRSSLLYGAETWSTTKSKEKSLEVNEMRMLCWMCGVTKKDDIRKEHVRGSVKVAPVTKKITEKRLKWYGHIKRRDEGHVLRRMTDSQLPGKRRKGRQKTRWRDSCERHMESAGLKRTYWTGLSGREMICSKPFRRPQMMGKAQREEE